MCLSRKSVMTTYRPKMELMSWVCVCVSVSECLCECLFLYVWMSDVFCVCDAKKHFPLSPSLQFIELMNSQQLQIGLSWAFYSHFSLSVC